MVEGLIVVDATGRVRLANRAAAKLFRFESPATGKTILEATRHHDVAAVVSRLDRELEVLDHELRIESVDSPRFIQVNALALRDIGGASDGAILVFHDLTRLRQLEGVRQEFVANVSHELRTPSLSSRAPPRLSSMERAPIRRLSCAFSASLTSMPTASRF